jgi:hypothetical protein
MESKQNETELARRKLAGLSGSARRLLDYVALLEGDARYAVLRHMARASEEDMVIDLRETVDAGVIAVLEGEREKYGFTNEAAHQIVMDEIGEARLPKLRKKANAARRRVLGERLITD